MIIFTYTCVQSVYICIFIFVHIFYIYTVNTFVCLCMDTFGGRKRERKNILVNLKIIPVWMTDKEIKNIKDHLQVTYKGIYVVRW